MPTDPNALLISNWMQQKSKRDPHLAELLGPKVKSLLEPDPKRISIERWDMMTKKEKQK